MTRPTVSLCIIAGPGIERYWDKCLASVVVPCIERYGGPAFDEIVVLFDEKSSEESKATARDYAEKQVGLGGRFLISDHAWPDDFSVARQRAFELATGDWRGWMDTDDVFVGAANIRPTISEGMSPDAVMLDLDYHYIVAPDGRVVQKQIRERFVRWDYGFKWIHPVHEGLLPSKSIHNPRRAYVEDGKTIIVHQRPESEIMEHGDRNNSLMDPDKATNPITRHRLLYHRAQFLKGRGERAKAEAYLREVVETKDLFTDLDSFTGAVWVLGELLAEDGRFDEAKCMALRLMERMPTSRRGRFLMGYVYARMQNHPETIRWMLEAFAMPKPEEYTQQNEEQFALLAAAASLAYPCPLELREAVSAICQREVNNPGKLKVPRDLQQVIRTTKMETTCREYLRYMEDHEEMDKARDTGLLIPYPLKRNVPIAIQRRRTANYIRKHATADFNGTWAGIPQEFVDAILADDRTKPGILSRAVWAAERVWANGWKRVFEIGACDGLISGYLAARFPDREFVAIDPDPFTIEHAKKRWNLPNLRFAHAPLGEEFSTLIDEYARWCDGWILFEVAEHVRHSFDLYLPNGKPGLITTPTTQPDSGAPPEITPGPAGHRRILTMAEILTDFAPSAATVIDGGMCRQTAIEVPDGRATSDLERPDAPWYLFLCQGSPVEWGPEAPYTRGLTGSEECVVFLAEALAKTGARVVVMADRLEGAERIVNGVFWTFPDYIAEHDLHDPDGELTTLVVWRQPIMTDFVKSLPVARRVLWLHDAAGMYAKIDPSAWADYDKIVCATEYQKRTFDERYPVADKSIVIRHGIPAMPVLPKIPGKVVYASSPDRGLERLLKWWPAVVAARPDAVLHILYGRNNMRAFGTMGFTDMNDAADRIEKMIAETPNVIDHGLVPHPELYRHLAEAKVLAYPTHFEEISCLTIQKAMAAKAAPVWSEAGCLGEVVGTRYHSFWTNPETLDSDEKARESFVRSALYWLDGGMDVTYKPQTWSYAAEQWREIIR